jgi:hypothetical protein
VGNKLPIVHKNITESVISTATQGSEEVKESSQKIIERKFTHSDTSENEID